MADKKLNLRIVTPSKLLYEGYVDMVIMRAEGGDIGVLPGHESLTTILSMGKCTFKIGSEEKHLSMLGGFAEIQNDCVTILSDMSEFSDDIDIERAIAAKERAENRLMNRHDNINVGRSELALRRALVRLEVSGYNK